ncbi:MAG: LacI family transcriptional regulator [Spirochaetia bacterium]|nr:LacI family transcriptional regulator [Spirochaetia bacterium]
MSKIRIDDIAKICNVSKATVSRVINNPEKVSKAQRDRILCAIRETGYIPNQFAQKLGRSEGEWGTALFVYDIVNPFFSLITRGLTTLSIQKNIPMFVFETLNNKDREELYLNTLIKNRVSGVVFTAGVSEEIVQRAHSQFPVVVIDQHCEHLNIPEVASDNYKGARQAVEYLLRLNHTKIAFIAGPGGWSSAQQRLEGYKSALSDAGIPFDPSYVFQGNLQMFAGIEACRHFTSLPQWPTAVFAANDQMALGFMNQAQLMNLSVPGDFSVIGFDGTPSVMQIRPQLTTISQDVGKISKTTMNLLFDSVRGKKVTGRHLIDTALEIGDTCARLRD